MVHGLVSAEVSMPLVSTTSKLLTIIFFKDEQLLHSHLPGCSVMSPSVDFSVQESDIIAKVPQLERQVLWAATPQTLLSAIDELFKFLAPSEQRGFVQKVCSHVLI